MLYTMYSEPSFWIFHPISLAMEAGVGSGSMMGAATGALVVVFPKDVKKCLIRRCS